MINFTFGQKVCQQFRTKLRSGITSSIVPIYKTFLYIRTYPLAWLERLMKRKTDAEGVTLGAGASQNLYLHLQPIDLATYAFYLPMVINQLLGPVSMLNLRSIRPSEFLSLREAHYAHLPNFVMTPLPAKLPTVAIDCTVASSVIFFSKLLFLFNTETNEVRLSCHD